MSDKPEDASTLSKLFENAKGFFESLSPQPQQNSDRETLAKTLPSLSKEKIATEIGAITDKESGWDRVKDLFVGDKQTGRAPEIFSENEQLLGSVMVVSFVLGGVIQSAETRENLARNSQLTIYTSKADKGMVRGGLKHSIRYVSFSGIILASSMMIQAYRNKSSVLDFTAGGAMSGGLLRMHHGLANLAFGSVVGSIFGTVFGVFRYWQLKQTGTRYEDRRYKRLEETIIDREILLNSMKPPNK